MSSPAIQVEALAVRYPKTPGFREFLFHPFRRDYAHALDGVSLSVPSGILFGFLGPNGAGKTTLIKVLTTLVLPTAGSARVGGADVAREPEQVKRRIGVVMTDERSFYWRLTGRQNLEFFAALHGLHGSERERRVVQLLDLAGFSDKTDGRFSSFSSGMKQRLAIARGLLSEPDIVFFDEPTRSLDPISAAQIRSFIREKLVRELGKTVFLTTHNLHEAEEISDRVGIINRGRILAEGTVPEISARLRSRENYRLVLAEAPETILRALGAIPGVVEAVRGLAEGAGREVIELTLSSTAKTVPDIVAMAVSLGGRVLECSRTESRLTEIFAELISEDTRPDHAA